MVEETDRVEEVFAGEPYKHVKRTRRIRRNI